MILKKNVIVAIQFKLFNRYQVTFNHGIPLLESLGSIKVPKSYVSINHHFYALKKKRIIMRRVLLKIQIQNTYVFCISVQCSDNINPRRGGLPKFKRILRLICHWSLPRTPDQDLTTNINTDALDCG